MLGLVLLASLNRSRMAAPEAYPALALAAPPVAPVVPAADLLCLHHRPPAYRAHLLKYWLFNAASHNCRRCVWVLVNRMGVNKKAKSECMGYTAFDYANWGNHPGMIRFLNELE